jgi:hypothetical protein
LRADSGFWNTKIMVRLQAAGWLYSIGVRQQKHIKAAITAIPGSVRGSVFGRGDRPGWLWRLVV